VKFSPTDFGGSEHNVIALDIFKTGRGDPQLIGSRGQKGEIVLARGAGRHALCNCGTGIRDGESRAGDRVLARVGDGTADTGRRIRSHNSTGDDQQHA
jgi:hypothetical protein